MQNVNTTYQTFLLGNTPITNDSSGSGTDDSNAVTAGIITICVIFILLVSLTILIVRRRKKKVEATSRR